jgi:hypothetical protein
MSFSLAFTFPAPLPLQPILRCGQQRTRTQSAHPSNSLHRKVPYTKPDPDPNEDKATTRNGSRRTHLIEIDVYAGGARGRGENLDNASLKDTRKWVAPSSSLSTPQQMRQPQLEYVGLTLKIDGANTTRTGQEGEEAIMSKQ